MTIGRPRPNRMQCDIDLERIFGNAIEQAFQEEEALLQKLLAVQTLCNESAQRMYIGFRIVSPEKLQLDYHGTPAGVLTQGSLDIALSKRQDGTTIFSPTHSDEAINADETAENVLGGFMQAIARQEALNGAYQAMSARL